MSPDFFCEEADFMPMKLTHGALAAAGAAALLAGLTAGQAAATVPGSWGRAQQVAAALNTGGAANIYSVSCASAGNCGAGGYYIDSSGAAHAFVVDETHGTWGTAQEVAAALNTGGAAYLYSVSCASAGNCSAGGTYLAGPGNHQAFVVDETHGTWGTAQEVPGSAVLNTGGNAVINSVSCTSAGNCSAGGSYYSGSPGSTVQQAFVVSETNGTWGTAQEVAGGLNRGVAGIASVSCASAGNCSAGGSYGDSSGTQAFVIRETHGTWGSAQEVGETLNTGGDAGISSVSCTSSGNCSAGGHYRVGSDQYEAMVVSESGGTWGTAQEVAGALNSYGDAVISSVSCTSAGNCSAGGYYTGPARSDREAFVVSETNGTWGSAQQVASATSISSVSCASAGNCSAGGTVSSRSHASQAVVVNETDGTWGAVQQVAGSLNTGGDAGISSVSCATATNCGAGGQYTQAPSSMEAFVVNMR